MCVLRCTYTHCCLAPVLILLSRITQDTIQPTDTTSNRAPSTPMPAMELSADVELSLLSLLHERVTGVISEYGGTIKQFSNDK